MLDIFIFFKFLMLSYFADATRTTWTRIKSNVFLHRNRRTLTIDEVWPDLFACPMLFVVPLHILCKWKMTC